MPAKVGKTLLIRLDRIGDLVLTLPVDESLRKIDPAAEIGWWIPKGLGFVANSAIPPRPHREVGLKFSWKVFKELLDELNRERPRRAIVFHAPWWVSLLLFWARVPIRAGPRSQWHQYLFFNRSLRQKRSKADRHELEYNFQLAEHALKLGPGWLPRNHLRLSAPYTGVLERFNLEPGSYYVVHPGMGGSALNWPLPMYTQLISRLTEEAKVVITGTLTDEPMLAPIRESLVTNQNVIWLDGKIGGRELIQVLENAKACLAPSTGVLHLAASTGVPTLGLFSPVPVQKPVRWGPMGERTAVLAPDVECPGHFRCLGPKCPHFDCMQNISVGQVQDTLKEISCTSQDEL